MLLKPVYYPHIPIGMLGDISFTVSSFFLCLSANFSVRDVSGVGCRRAMKFGRISVWVAGHLLWHTCFSSVSYFVYFVYFLFVVDWLSVPAESTAWKDSSLK